MLFLYRKFQEGVIQRWQKMCYVRLIIVRTGRREIDVVQSKSMLSAILEKRLITKERRIAIPLNQADYHK